jgi:hypothetical protein
MAEEDARAESKEGSLKLSFFKLSFRNAFAMAQAWHHPPFVSQCLRYGAGVASP